MLRSLTSRTSRRATRTLISRRFFGDSLYSRGGYVEEWPVTKTNTIINIVSQGQVAVVERFGKFHALKKPGFFFAIPLVDKIAYVVDMREKAIEIEPQPAITRDNVSLEVSGNVFIEFCDPERAAYGSFNPLYAVSQNAQASMRAAIGRLELDEILHAREALNDQVRSHLSEAAEPWGISIKRYEITEILPDEEIQRAMDKQAVAERERREQVLAAEGLKKSQILESEGIKIKKQNESEGELTKVRNEALAEKEKRVLEAEGEAQAILTKANAQAEALRAIGNALDSDQGRAAAQLDIAKDYLEMYGEMGSQSNTMVFSKEPGDVHAMLAQAAAVLTTTSESVKKN